MQVSLTRNLHLLMLVACAHPGYPISVRKLSHVIASFSHQIEDVLFDARNSHEKNLAAIRYDTCTSFSRKLTRASFSYKFLVRLSSALAVISLLIWLYFFSMECWEFCERHHVWHVRV